MKKKQVKTPLEMLSEKSNNAINLVLQTIKGLRDTNDAIDAERHKNEETIVSIQATNNSLSDLKSQNEKIIGNFEALIQ
jgi:hypothetical protein